MTINVTVTNGERTWSMGENTLEAVRQAAIATEKAYDASVSEAVALSAAGPNYASTAAGLAATVNGQSFAVDTGDGMPSIYLNSAGSAVLQRKLATTQALAGDNGFTLIKHKRSETGAYGRTARQMDMVAMLGAPGLPVMHFLDPDYDEDLIDGTADAVDFSAMIQNGLNAGSGKQLVFPQFLIPSAAQLNVVAGTKGIVGQGGGVKMTGAFGMVLPGLTDFHIADLVIDKNDQGGLPALYAISTRGGAIVRVSTPNCSASSGIVMRADDDVAANDVEEMLVAFCTLDGTGASAGYYGIELSAKYTDDDNAGWLAAPGTLLASANNRRARNSRIIGNTIYGYQYQIGLAFADGNTIALNTLRDKGGAINGGVRGISIQHTSKGNLVQGNPITNTQSSAVHLSRGATHNKIIANSIYNEVWDYGNVAVNGSQAPLQAQLGCTDNEFLDNPITFAGAGVGPEFVFNLGPHCHRTRFEGNSYTGKVVKAGINIEPCYVSAGAPATSYASGGTWTQANSATQDLDGVICVGNRINLSTVDTVVQLVHAGTIGITNILERDNPLLGTTATTRFAQVGSGTGARTGEANWDNEVEIELPQTGTINVFGGTNFKASTAGYVDYVVINGGKTGQVINIRMNNAGTVQGSGAINLVGGVAVPSSVTSRVQLRSQDGTNWYELNRVA
jgi:hypothetical protein